MPTSLTNTPQQDMVEYLAYKLEDEGLDGVAEHGLEYVHQLWPKLAVDIETWYQDGVSLERQLIDAVNEAGTT